MKPLRRIAFLLEEFQLGTPAQQLLDRFLIGYPRGGTFHQLPDLEVTACLLLNNNQDSFGDRIDDFDLSCKINPEEAVRDADAVVIVSRGAGATANDSLLRVVLEGAPEGAACFVHGVLASSIERAHEQVKLAEARKIRVLAGTPLAVTWRLPEIDLPSGTSLREAMIVVQGRSLGAELLGLDGLFPLLERRQGGESGVHSVRLLEGGEVWRGGDKGFWSWPLLASAISRSDALQGDTIADGRTQDIVGTGLIRKLAAEPRAFLLEHRDGLRSSILVLDGALADFNFALQAADGRIYSAQLYRAAPPAEHHYSQLAGVIEDFFLTGELPWPLERNILIAGLLETFASPSTHLTERAETPQLAISYPPGPPRRRIE